MRLHQRPETTVSASVPRRLRKELTRQEVRVWKALRGWRPAGFHFRRQMPIGRHVVDFACLKQRLVVEIDGSQHGEDPHVASDRARDASLARQGFRVLRFWNNEVDRNFDGVMEAIFRHLTRENPSP
ncbi:endonuclease domain-containing protein [Salinarimonas sp.]|uniref:endonuclease domain-containing protein n=1 Tax=Salinarimonas sp. TaxID=2766526 RepID=UPI0039196516